MKRLMLFISVFILTTFSISSIFSSTVFAASPYDNILFNGNPPYLISNNGVNISNTFENAFQIGEFMGSLTLDDIRNRGGGFCGWDGLIYFQAVYDAIQAIQNGKPYYINATQGGPNGEHLLRVIVDMADSSNLSWNWSLSPLGLNLVSSSSSLTVFTLQYRNATSQTILCLQGGFSHSSVQVANGVVNATNYVESNIQLTYPPDYNGFKPTTVSNKKIVYPGFSLIVQDDPNSDNSKIKLVLLDDWIDQYNLPPPDVVLFTITTMDDSLIVPDRCWGPSGCDWNALPLGDYKARLDVVYNSEAINDVYEFRTMEAWFKVNNTSYTMLYNPNEGKFCTVRNGYEWNCSIPQPGDEPEVITGDPEQWEPEACDLAHLDGCVRNILHWLGEYLGLNGPSIQPGSSIFFQFDTNTFGLTAILTSPLTILTNLQTAQYVCIPVNLPLPFIGSNMPLPCMHDYYTTYLGPLYNVWQVIINGLVAYYVIAGLLSMVKDAKDPKKDQIEVLKL